jgi:hypothetical protein
MMVLFELLDFLSRGLFLSAFMHTIPACVRRKIKETAKNNEPAKDDQYRHEFAYRGLTAIPVAKYQATAPGIAARTRVVETSVLFVADSNIIPRY